MLKTYPAIFHEEEVGFRVEFPEFQGCTQGNSLEGAMSEAKDFLAYAIASEIDKEAPLPEPSDIRNLTLTDGFATLIQVDPTPYIRGKKVIRKNVTIPEWVAQRADKHGINYSETLTQALLDKLKI